MRKHVKKYKKKKKNISNVSKHNSAMKALSLSPILAGGKKSDEALLKFIFGLLTGLTRPLRHTLLHYEVKERRESVIVLFSFYLMIDS